MNMDVSGDRRVPWSPEPLLPNEDDFSADDTTPCFSSNRSGRTTCPEGSADIHCTLEAMSNLSFNENDDEKTLQNTRQVPVEIGDIPEGDNAFFLEAKCDYKTSKTSNFLSQETASERKSEIQFRLEEGDFVQAGASANLSCDQAGEHARFQRRESKDDACSSSAGWKSSSEASTILDSVRKHEERDMTNASFEPETLEAPAYIAKSNKNDQERDRSSAVDGFRNNGFTYCKEVSPGDVGWPVMYFDQDKRLIIATDGPVNVAISLHRVRPTPIILPEKPAHLVNAEEMDMRLCSSNDNINDDYLGSSSIVSYAANLEAQDDGVDEGMEIPISGYEDALYHRSSIYYRDEADIRSKLSNARPSPVNVPYERLLNEYDEVSYDDEHYRRSYREIRGVFQGEDGVMAYENYGGDATMDRIWGSPDPPMTAYDYAMSNTMVLQESDTLTEGHGFQMCESTGNVSTMGCAAALRSRKKNTVQRIMGFFRKFDSQKRKKKRKK